MANTERNKQAVACLFEAFRAGDVPIIRCGCGLSSFGPRGLPSGYYVASMITRRWPAAVGRPVREALADSLAAGRVADDADRWPESRRLRLHLRAPRGRGRS